MIFDLNQQAIYKKINELEERINELYMISKDDAVELKKELAEIEKHAIEDDNKKPSDTLCLYDDSDSTNRALDRIEKKIDIKLSVNKEVKIDMDSYQNVLDVNANNPKDQLEILKETYDSFRSKSPSKLQINLFTKMLVKKILELLDDNIMKYEDIEYFAHYLLDIQLIKNIMFLHKAEQLGTVELNNFKTNIDKYNSCTQIEDLFSYYTNNKIVPVAYDFLKEEEEIEIDYPLFFDKNISKLITSLTYKIYGQNNKNFWISKKEYLKFNSLSKKHYLSHYIFIFTKTNGLKVVDEENFESIDKNDPFFSDIIGIVTPRNFYLYKTEYPNLKFIYSSGEIHLGYLDDCKVEFMSCKKVDVWSHDRNKIHFPKLRVICVEYGSSYLPKFNDSFEVIDKSKQENIKELKKTFKNNK